MQNANHPPEPLSDACLADELRRAAFALAEAMPEKIEAAPLNQIASALKTTVEVLRMLEPPDDAEQQPPEQIIRWEFVYDGAVHEAPPWARKRDDAYRPVQGGGVRSPVG